MSDLVNSLSKMNSTIQAIKTEPFDALANLTESELKTWQFAIAQEMTPIAQQMMLANYRASGEGVKNGDLLRAIGSVKVVPYTGGFKIVMPGGLPRDIYIAASVAKAGAIYGKKGLSAGRKKSLKKLTIRAKGPGVSRPKPPFMTVLPNQVKAMAILIDRAYRKRLVEKGIK